jgi:hypothetical protein
MADLSITAASVLPGANGTFETGAAGQTITAGQAVYKDPTTHLYLLADCNSAVAAARVPLGIALNGGAINQPIKIQKSGLITIGATLTAGVAYYLSGTAGAIRPVADNTTGDYPCLIGMAQSTTVLNIDFDASPVAL